ERHGQQREHAGCERHPETGNAPGRFDRKQRSDEERRGVEKHLADARVAEHDMQRSGDPSIEGLLPESTLAAFKPVPLDENAMRSGYSSSAPGSARRGPQ